MAAIEQQIFAVLSWIILLCLLQLAICPLLQRTFNRFAFPVSFSGSLLLFTLISWYCGIVRLPVYLALIPFTIILGVNVYQKKYTAVFFADNLKWEFLFLVAFLFILEIRFVSPTISFAEKFMDHAFLASIIRNPVIPPLDPWFAGGYLNVYYYLGYWIFGCLSIVSGVPSNISFNLALPTIFSYTALNMIALASLIVNRYRLALLIPLFLVNPSFIYQVLLGKGLNAAIWESTRTIANTINEYPIFSFLWGDVHAHVVGMFNQVFIIFLLVFAYTKWNTLESQARGIVIGLCILSLGSMPLINSWDVLIYAPITLLFGILIWWKNRNDAKAKRSAFVFLLAIPVISIILYLPFYIQMRTQGVGGLFIVATPSDPLQFLLVHGFFLAVFYVIIGQDIIKRPYLLLIVIPFLLTGFYAAAIAVVPLAFFAARKDLRPEDLLAVLGLAITIFCEIFYLRDNMGETYFRMNTVFKFYIAAWLLMGAASCAMAADWLGRQKIPSIINSYSRDILITGTIILFIIPLAVPFNYHYGGYTLDGLAYLEKAHPGDSAAVSYLRSLPGNDFCLVEAEGGDYQYYSRISSFTGIPAITGMPFHEVMWRGNKDNWYGERVSDIRMIYEKPDRTVPLMKKYNCSYLIVGDPERERYTVSILADAFDNVFSRQGTTIYRIRS